MNISGMAVYDALGCIVQQGQPVFQAGYSDTIYSTTIKKPTIITYDVLDRPLLVTLPDTNTVQSSYSREK